MLQGALELPVKGEVLGPYLGVNMGVTITSPTVWPEFHFSCRSHLPWKIAKLELTGRTIRKLPFGVRDLSNSGVAGTEIHQGLHRNRGDHARANALEETAVGRYFQDALQLKMVND